MQSSTGTMVALAATLIFIFIVPLMTLTTRNDNVTQENLKREVNQFVTEIKNTGKLTRENFQEFQNKIDATGSNEYNIEIEIQHLDENPGKKTVQTNYTKIGENVYYSEYTTQILPKIGIKVDNQPVENATEILLKEGDIVYVSVKNENMTAAQTLKSSFVGSTNAGEYAIVASSSGMVTVNGVEE